MKEVKIICVTNRVNLPDLGISLSRGQSRILDKRRADASLSLADAKKMRAVMVSEIKRAREVKRNPAPPFNRNGGRPIGTVARKVPPPAPPSIDMREVVRQEMDRYIKALHHEMAAFKHEILSEFKKIIADAILSSPVVASTPAAPPMQASEETTEPQSEEVSDWGWDDEEGWDDVEEEVFIPDIKITGNFSSGDSLVSEDSSESSDSALKKLREIKKQ